MFDETAGEDYFALNKDGVPADARFATFIDILSHKVLFAFHDDLEGGLKEEEGFGYLPQIYFGLSLGNSGLVMAKLLSAPIGVTLNLDALPGFYDLSGNFALYFGFSGRQHEAFEHQTIWRVIPPRRLPSLPNDEFTGTYAFDPVNFPPINIVPDLIETRYPTTLVGFLPVGYELNYLPEVGYGRRTQLTAPVYLYKSKDSTDSQLNGGVVGVLQERAGVRTACYLFTPIATDEAATATMMESTLNFLTARFNGGSAIAYKGFPSNPKTTSADIADRRRRAESYLDYLSEYADPEVVQKLGIQKDFPYKVRKNLGKLEYDVTEEDLQHLQ
jgi:hypothetical protein